METVQRYVAEYHEWFYLITVVWTFLEGETFVIVAAALAARGVLDPFVLGLCAWLGSWGGDQCWFLLGRHFGHLLVARMPQSKPAIDRVHRWLERWDVLFILSFRFLYGIRNFSSAALGLSDVNFYRFLVLNLIGAGIWAVVFVGAGYVGGQAIARLMGQWGDTFELVFLGLFVAAAIAVWLAVRLRSRRSRGAAAVDPGTQP